MSSRLPTAVAFTIAIVGAIVLGIVDASAIAVYLVGFAAIAAFFAAVLWEERPSRHAQPHSPAKPASPARSRSA